MASHDDVPLIEYGVQRALSAPVLRVRFFFVRLTDSDLAVVLLFSSLTWIIVQAFGWGKAKIFLFLTADPFVGFIVAGLLILGISALRELEPKSDILQTLRGFAQPKLYAPRTHAGDRLWRPSRSSRAAIIPEDYRLRLWQRQHLR
ncbi:MAG: hypothetical protein ACREAC_14255 [Blastocatellia bacterium]